MSCELPTYDICILQNQTFKLPLTFKNDDGTPMDLTSWAFTGSLKERYNDATPVMFLTSSFIIAASGSLQLYLSADMTWELTGSRYVYDLIGTNLA